jgi:hypothetical protein
MCDWRQVDDDPVTPLPVINFLFDTPDRLTLRGDTNKASFCRFLGTSREKQSEQTYAVVGFEMSGFKTPKFHNLSVTHDPDFFDSACKKELRLPSTGQFYFA